MMGMSNPRFVPTGTHDGVAVLLYLGEDLEQASALQICLIEGGNADQELETTRVFHNDSQRAATTRQSSGPLNGSHRSVHR
jgi:hypothetical protein